MTPKDHSPENSKLALSVFLTLAIATTLLYLNEKFMNLVPNLQSAFETVLLAGVVAGLVRFGGQALLFRAFIEAVRRELAVVWGAPIREVSPTDVTSMLGECSTAEIHMSHAPDVQIAWLKHLQRLGSNLVISLPSDSVEPRWKVERGKTLEVLRETVSGATVIRTRRRPSFGLLILDSGSASERLLYSPYPSPPQNVDLKDHQPSLIKWYELRSGQCSLGTLLRYEAEVRKREGE